MSKHNENRRKLNVTKLARQISKKNEHPNKGSDSGSGLSQQYQVIKEDLMKLREDLNRGYDMAKEAVDKKTILNELMKLKANF